MLSIIADLISLITDTLSNFLWYSDERTKTNLLNSDDDEPQCLADSSLSSYE